MTYMCEYIEYYCQDVFDTTYKADYYTFEESFKVLEEGDVAFYVFVNNI